MKSAYSGELGESSKIKGSFRSLLDIVGTVVLSVVAVLAIRAFVVQPFLVSGRSMEPTFSDGDYLLIDELSYRFREPQRGDVIVFKRQDNSFFIKRIVALPGEEMVIQSGGVFVTTADGEELGRLEEVYSIPSRTFGNHSVTLKDEEYFVMGDNRSFSFDSRKWGPLLRSDIVGLVRFRLWPLDTAMAIGTPSYGTLSEEQI